MILEGVWILRYHLHEGHDSHRVLLPIPESVMARVGQELFGGDDLSDQEGQRPPKKRSRKWVTAYLSVTFDIEYSIIFSPGPESAYRKDEKKATRRMRDMCAGAKQNQCR
jgi:hypothetical protein